MKVGALGAAVWLSGFPTGTADTVVRTEVETKAKKVGECEATTGLMGDLPMGELPKEFCLQMTIDKDEDKLETYYASDLVDPNLASFAFIEKDGETGKFAYKNDADEVQYTGTLEAGKNLCFKKSDGDFSYAGDESKMLSVTLDKFKDASHFAWVAPDKNHGNGAFVYKLKNGAFQKFDLNTALTMETREPAAVVHRVASAVSAASAVQLADESATPGLKGSLCGGRFCFMMTIGAETISEEDLANDYHQSTWGHVTMRLDGYYAGNIKPALTEFAFISPTSGGIGKFAYKQVANGGVTHTGTFGENFKKSLCFNTKFSQNGDQVPYKGKGKTLPKQMLDVTVSEFKEYASHFGWLSPTESGDHGAFVYQWQNSGEGANLFRKLKVNGRKKLYVKYSVTE